MGERHRHNQQGRGDQRDISDTTRHRAQTHPNSTQAQQQEQKQKRMRVRKDPTRTQQAQQATRAPTRQRLVSRHRKCSPADERGAARKHMQVGTENIPC